MKDGGARDSIAITNTFSLSIFMENPAALRRDMETVRDAETKDALREIFP